MPAVNAPQDDGPRLALAHALADELGADRGGFEKITFRIAGDEVQPVLQILPAVQRQVQDQQVVPPGAGEEQLNRPRGVALADIHFLLDGELPDRWVRENAG